MFFCSTNYILNPQCYLFLRASISIMASVQLRLMFALQSDNYCTQILLVTPLCDGLCPLIAVWGYLVRSGCGPVLRKCPNTTWPCIQHDLHHQTPWRHHCHLCHTWSWVKWRYFILLCCFVTFNVVPWETRKFTLTTQQNMFTLCPVLHFWCSQTLLIN